MKFASWALSLLLPSVALIGVFYYFAPEATADALQSLFAVIRDNRGEADSLIQDITR